MSNINQLENYDKFPVHLKRSEGELLTKFFIEKPSKKPCTRLYYYEYNGYRYLLFEEIMLEEGNYFLDFNRVLDRNFYLNREKL